MCSVRTLKAAEAPLVRREALPTAGNTFLVVADDIDDVDSGANIVGGRKSSHATADFKTGFQNVCAGPKETVANPEGQVHIAAPKTQDSGLVEEGGYLDEVREFMQYLHKPNAALRAECATEKPLVVRVCWKCLHFEVRRLIGSRVLRS